MFKQGKKNPFQADGIPLEHVSCVFFKDEDPFVKMSPEKRSALLRKMGRASGNSFKQTTKKIEKTLRRFNPFQILGHFGYYDLLVYGNKKDDYEYVPVDQGSLEWLQALVLQVPEDRLRMVMDSAPSPLTLSSLNEQMNEVCVAFALKSLSDGPLSHTEVASTLIRQHTAFVRNEGYPSQILRCLQELSAPMDAVFQEREGFKLTELVSFLWALPAVVQKRVNDDFKLRKRILTMPTAAGILAEFQAVTGNDPAAIERAVGQRIHDIPSVQNIVMNWFDSKNFRFFYFQLSELQELMPEGLPEDRIKEVLSKLSIKWGALAGIDAESLFLNNPIWARPLIAVGNHQYFLPVPALTQSFGLEMIEGFLKDNHGDLFATYKKDIRSDFLERRTEEAVRKAFPTAMVYRNLKWGNPHAGGEGENDVLVLLDNHAFVFECKSGQARLSAKCGSFEELRQASEKLIQGPSSQGKRFTDFLLRNRKRIQLKDTSGKIWDLDLRALLDVTQVNVHLDYFGPLTTKSLLLKKSNLIDVDSAPTATMPLHDLETVLEVLDRPSFVFHYLKRRAELESSNDVVATELDWLSTYLGTSFDFGEVEGDGRTKLAFTGMASQLDAFFMGREIGTPTCMPRLRLTPWWRACLEEFERRRFPGWLFASYALLCVRFELQDGFEMQVNRFRANMTRRFRPGEDDTCVLIAGYGSRKTAVAVLCIWDEPAEVVRPKVSARMAEISGKFGVERVLVLVLPAEQVSEPYFGAYYWYPGIEDHVISGMRLMS